MAEDEEREEIIWYTFYSERENREYYYEPRSQVATWVLPDVAQLHPSRTKRTKPGATPKKPAPTRRRKDLHDTFAIQNMKKNTNEGFLKVVTSTRFGMVYLVLNVIFIGGLFIANDSNHKFAIGAILRKLAKGERESISLLLGEATAELPVNRAKSLFKTRGDDLVDENVQQNAMHDGEMAHSTPQPRIFKLDDELPIHVSAISTDDDDHATGTESTKKASNDNFRVAEIANNDLNVLDSSNEESLGTVDGPKLINSNSESIEAKQNRVSIEENFVSKTEEDATHHAESEPEYPATVDPATGLHREEDFVTEDNNESIVSDVAAHIDETKQQQAAYANQESGFDDNVIRIVRMDADLPLSVAQRTEGSDVGAKDEDVDHDDIADRHKPCTVDESVPNKSTMDSGKLTKDNFVVESLDYDRKSTVELMKDEVDTNHQDDSSSEETHLQRSTENKNDVTEAESVDELLIKDFSAGAEHHFVETEEGEETSEPAIETNADVLPTNGVTVNDAEIDNLIIRESTTHANGDAARASTLEEKRSNPIEKSVVVDVTRDSQEAISLSAQSVATETGEEMGLFLSENARNKLHDIDHAGRREAQWGNFKGGTDIGEDISDLAAQDAILAGETYEVDSMDEVEIETMTLVENEELEHLIKYIEEVSLRSKALVGAIVQKVESQISTSGHVVELPHPKRCRFNPELFFRRKLAFDALGERETAVVERDSENELICEKKIVSRLMPHCAIKRLSRR